MKLGKKKFEIQAKQLSRLETDQVSTNFVSINIETNRLYV